MPEIFIKSNGYEINSKLQKVIDSWISFLSQNPDVKSFKLFYYGDRLVFADCVLLGGYYGHFSITDRSVHLSGYHCSNDQQFFLFASATLHDPCFAGKLEVSHA